VSKTRAVRTLARASAPWCEFETLAAHERVFTDPDYLLVIRPIEDWSA